MVRACEEWALYFEEIKTPAGLEQRKEESVRVPTGALWPGLSSSSFPVGSLVERGVQFLDTCSSPEK